MKDLTLQLAINEAKRFIAKAEELKEVGLKYSWANPKESGAVRRASMDLTRILADLRLNR